MRAAPTSVLFYVVIGTYVGFAALAHDLGFGLCWIMLSTLLIWAAPAQVILASALGSGASPVETALAVGLSSARLLPMVMSLLPLLRRPGASTGALLLPSHLTAISVWIEALRLLPAVPRQYRVPFTNGLGVGLMIAAQVGGAVGFYLVGSLPPLLTAGLLFLTPRC